VRETDYQLQLREKQKAKYLYGLLERQFRGYCERAVRQGGVTGENLLRLLELRLDNVIFRLGFAATRRQARQLVVHRHFLLNGRRANRPSHRLRPDDVVALRPGSPAEPLVREAGTLIAMVPAWLEADHDGLRGRVLRRPDRGEIDATVREQLIVEFYSR
jgi:small subunit ribosomal protein S4